MPTLHLIFETLGFFAGFRYYLYLRKQQQDPITDGNRVIILVAATFGAFLGSRMLGALEHPDNLIKATHPLLSFYANKTIVGALLGGLFSVELAKKGIHERHSSGDLFTYPLILAMMIGRIGCFTAGLEEETYGNPTTWWTGINLGDGVPRHPVTLYEIAFLGLLWFALEKAGPFKPGYRFQFFMIAYLAFRFALDYIKPHYSYIAGLGAIQIACLGGLAYYGRTIFTIFTNFKTIHGKQA